MQKSGVSERIGTHASLLFKRVCPVWRACRKPKVFQIRKDGFVFYQGAWRSISAILRLKQNRPVISEARKKARAERGRAKYASDVEASRKKIRERWHRRSEADRKEKSKQRMQRARAYRELENERRRKWYAENRSDQTRKERERRTRRDPTRGLFTLIAEFRKGNLTAAEFTRRYDERLKRLDEISREDGKPE